CAPYGQTQKPVLVVISLFWREIRCGSLRDVKSLDDRARFYRGATMFGDELAPLLCWQCIARLIEDDSPVKFVIN
ncbi:MAG TPA: hypothetical protein VKA19_11215, partial [Alphaproteobacteria bacterium]|nr:hypothetical protein [Alphaproteobacteria bacterium]